MTTFVSMVTWHRSMAAQADVRARIDAYELSLWCMGMHSIIFVSDHAGESSAVLVSTCADHAAAALIAEKVLGDALIRVDSLRFDEPAGLPAWMVQPATPLPPTRRPARKRRNPQPAQLAA